MTKEEVKSVLDKVGLSSSQRWVICMEYDFPQQGGKPHSYTPALHSNYLYIALRKIRKALEQK